MSSLSGSSLNYTDTRLGNSLVNYLRIIKETTLDLLLSIYSIWNLKQKKKCELNKRKKKILIGSDQWVLSVCLCLYACLCVVVCAVECVFV